MRVLLVIYDNDSYIHWFPQGAAYIAAVCRKAGHEVAIWNQDVHHYPDEALTEYLDTHEFDVVGIGVIAGYYQYRKLLNLSKAINNSRKRPFFILGGHGPSPEPEYFLKKTQADAAVIGEGELTIIELLEYLEDKKPLAEVKGIAFREGDTVTVTPRRPLIQDLDSIPFPAYDLFPILYYRLFRRPHAKNSEFSLPVLSGRGCPFKCNFCYRMDEGFRPRSNESIIEEIKLLKKDFGINVIAFSDDLLMCSVQRTVSLCEDFLKHKLNITWTCNGRLNYAKPDVIELMKKAGCTFINYGIEAMDDAILRTMNKNLTTAQIIKGVEATLDAGISPGLNVIFGNIGENARTLQQGVDFLLKYDDAVRVRTIRPVTPYPGSDLYYYAIEKGLLKDAEDFYEHKHLNSDLMAVNFTELTDEEYYKALYKANDTLLKNHHETLYKKSSEVMKKLYFEGATDFRGFKHT